jgi:hypothetical protein
MDTTARALEFVDLLEDKQAAKQAAFGMAWLGAVLLQMSRGREWDYVTIQVLQAIRQADPEVQRRDDEVFESWVK